MAKLSDITVTLNCETVMPRIFFIRKYVAAFFIYIAELLVGEIEIK